MTYVQDLINALSLGSLFALIALGIALIFGIMRLVNFAHGELVMVGGYVLYLLAGHVSWPIWVLATLSASVGAALLMERIAFRPVRGADPATLLVTSFAVSYLLQYLAILVISPQPKGVGVSTVLLEQISISGVTVSKLDVITAATTFALFVALALFLKRTAIGVQMRAAAEDFQMARFLGVPANRVIASAFAASGLMAGVVSILWVGQTGAVSPTLGLAPFLAGVVGAVIGGMGSLVGSIIGGYVLGGLTVALDVFLPEHLRPYRDAFVFTAVIVILLFRPQGLVPGRSGVRV
jgi:branched-chain amino acid transport system permease protein